MSFESFIGDPTFLGWLVTIAYFVGAILCWPVGAKSRASPDTQVGAEAHAWFRLSLAILLLLLGLNKQLDLQGGLIGFGRDLARQLGLYAQRRHIQAVLMVLLALFLASGLLLFYKINRSSFQAHPGALLGILMLFSFVLLRAFTFNHVFESFLNNPAVNGLVHALELLALIVISVSMARTKRH